MKDEVQSAANFITNMMRKTNNANLINNSQLETFRDTLVVKLKYLYKEHWFIDNPTKGSGYRCIRINHKMDPILSQVGAICNFPEEALRRQLPNELTMWVDPWEVSYRIGENGSICVLYKAKCDNRSTSSLSSRMSTDSNSSEDEDIRGYSPMSTSPTISYDSNLSSCKSEFRFNNRDMENVNNFYELVSN